MNIKFQKALMKLDKGDYEQGETLIKEALLECTNEFEMIPIKCCYAELLMKLERYTDALETAAYIVENTDEYSDNNHEREQALEIIDYLNRNRG